MAALIHIAHDAACRILQHVLRQGRLYADPEGVVHDEADLGQIAADAVVDALHVGLAGEVAGKEQARADFVLVEGDDNPIRSAAWIVSQGTERS